jgi:hypothetical protein
MRDAGGSGRTSGRAESDARDIVHDGSPLVVLVPVVAFGRPILVGPPCEHACGDDAAGDEHESYQPKYR